MEYPKLIRDRIPQIVKHNEGVEPAVRRLTSDQEFMEFVLKKVVEEARELAGAQSDSDMQEEIADLYEVIGTLIKLKGFTRDGIAAVQADKRSARGGFDERLVMLERPQTKRAA